MSVHLTISSSNFDTKCASVVRALQASGTRTALIVPSVTTIGSDQLENACIVTLPMSEYGVGHKNNLEKLWIKLSKQLNLTCAFLKIEGIYAGCLLNYLQKSVCPFSESSKIIQTHAHTKRFIPAWLYWL